MSFYATLGYSYASKYTLSFSFRQDASNKFGQNTNNRFNPVLSAGIRWNVSEELHAPVWMVIQLDVESILRISRKSPGYQSLSDRQFQHCTGRIDGRSILSIKNLPNKDLKWEKTNSFNGGIELSISKQPDIRSIDYYHKNG